MTQYQMLKKLAECKAKLRFVESEVKNITEFFAMMLYEIRQKLEEVEARLDELSSDELSSTEKKQKS